jgi:signal transduction histidine kinase
MFIHCAYDMDHLDQAYRNLQQRRDEELREDAEKTVADLASLRNRLLLISTLTFLAAIGGTFGLIHAGLSPLRRLSEAVSRVSPHDFRLPFPERRLPAELKPIVGRLRETLALLKRTFAREKQATADISHELRTPLAVLLTTTELGLRKPRTAEQYRELLGDCRSSAQQMNEVVQRLLTLARLDAGVDLLNNRPVDVTQLAVQCATMVRPLAEAQGLTLQVEPSPTLVVNTDPDKMREVLNNLLHNAIQYNRPHGRIDIRVAQDTNRVRLEVSDTGIGIAADATEQIFERFYRADPSRGGDGLHAGLGLALVKEYVGLMGGRIAVNSIEGQGSTFQVWLPA